MTDLDLLESKVLTLVQQGYWEDVCDVLTEDILSQLNSANLHYYKAVALLFLNKDHQSLDEFTKAIVINPKNDDMLWQRGVLLMELGENDLALIDFINATEHNPKNENAVAYIGEFWFYKKEYDKAIDYYTKAIEINALNQLPYFKRSEAWKAVNNFENYLADVNKAIQLSNDRTNALFSRGKYWYNLGQYRRAIEDFSAIINKTPKDYEVFRLRGVCWRDIKETDKAIEDFTRAIELNPEFRDAYINRGNTYLEKEEYAKAMVDYSEVIRINPDDYEVLSNRGALWNRKGESKLAIEDCTTSISIRPTAQSFVNRGNAFLNLGQYDMALSDYDNALQINIQFVEAWVNKGTVFTQTGQYKNAINAFERALEIDDTQGHFFFRMAMACEKDGQFYRAMANYKRAYYLGYIDEGLVYVFANSFPSAFILQELFNNLITIDNIAAYGNEVVSMSTQCKKINQVLEYGDLLEIVKPLSDLLRLHAICNFYMGHPARSFNIYDREIDESDLTLKDQYYFAISADGFLEPNTSILMYGMKQAAEMQSLTPEEMYYAGQIHVQAGEFEKAIGYFREADNYLPALYGLVGIYKGMKKSSEINEITLRILNIEKTEGELHLLNGISRLQLHPNLPIEEFRKEFCKRLFYYELMDEIANIRATVNTHSAYTHLEFNEIFIWHELFESQMNSIIETRNARSLEKIIIELFIKKAGTTSLEKIKQDISNNYEAITILTRTEQGSRVTDNTVEKMLAIAISKMQESADWYSMVIKYFYLEHRLTARAAVILHYYVIRIASQKKHKATLDAAGAEIRSWLALKYPILKSPLLIKLLIMGWVNLVDGPKEKEINDYKDYQAFKKHFRTEFFAWWKDDVFRDELMAKQLRPG